MKKLTFIGLLVLLSSLFISLNSKPDNNDSVFADDEIEYLMNSADQKISNIDNSSISKDRIQNKNFDRSL